MANDISTLRDHLFGVIEQLKDKDKPMDIARAKAVSDVAQVIINSAKVEVEMAKATGAKVSGFLTGPGTPGVTTHRLPG